MSKKKNIPEIRFKGFDDEWEDKKLHEVAIKIGDGLHGTPKYVEDGGVYFINGNNLISGNIFITDETKQVSVNEQSKDDRTLDNNTILMSINGTIGNLAYYQGEKVMLSKSVAYIILKIINKVYIYSYFQTQKIKNHFNNNLTGSTIQNLGLKTIRETDIFIPKNTTEQSRIGIYFQNLDNLINLKQKKYDKLVTLKKAMLEKMFPKDGSDVPEIRFKGFIEKWEEKKLGDLITITTGKLDANAMKADGDYDFYTSGIQKYKIDIPAFTGPAITIAGNGATVGYMHLADGMFNAYQRTYVLTNFAINRYFIFVSIGNVLPLKIKQEARTGNIPYIVLDMLTDLSIYIPKEKEQIKIGNYFQNLDKLISLQQKELDKLKNIKKACLEKMFV